MGGGTPGSREVGYETFMDMTADEDIGQVQIDQGDNEIVFLQIKTALTIYKTGMVDDPDLTTETV